MTSPWRLVFTSAAAVLLTPLGMHAAPPKANEPSTPAAPPEPDAPREPKVKATLLSERPSLVPGTTATLGLHFTIRPEWHIYSNALSDSGSPPTAQWTLPPRFKVQPTLWPAPKRHLIPGGMLDHVYEREVLLLIPVTVPADAKPGASVTIAAELNWMVCKDLCLIESQRVSIDLPVASQNAEQIVPDPKFTVARGKLPQRVALGKDSDGEKAGITATWSGDALKIQVKEAKALTFYPLDDSLVPVNIIADGAVTADALSIRFEPAEGGDGAKAAPVRGVLEIKRSRPGAPETGVEFYELSIPRPPAR